MLEGSREEATLAVDLYNQPRQPRRLEAYLVHMHLAWLYLLHARFRRQGTDYQYRLPNGRIDRIDGEPRTWELARCVRERWPDQGPVRANLELTIALRNKVEHRYHEAINLVSMGYAQALLLNYEEELTSTFGDKQSLAQILRFPVFVGTITGIGATRLTVLRNELPRDTRDFLASFEAGIGPGIAGDHHFEFRINLIPKLGHKTGADASMSFVRESDLTQEERATLEHLSLEGRVVVREQERSVASAGLLRVSDVANLLNQRLPFIVGVHHVVRGWKALGCRPPHGATRPERTDERYCVYDHPHRDYLYTPAFVDKLAREMSTETAFRAFTGLTAEPRRI